MPGGQRKAQFYAEIFSNLDRGEYSSLLEFEKNLDPAIDLNYKHSLPKDKNAKILDLGCGWGYFLHYLKEKGCSNIEGIDLSYHARRINFIKEHITKNASAIENPQDYLRSHVNEYDFIMLQQVIYYFKRDDLLSMMSSLRDALKPEGLLVIETFNGSLLTSVFVQNWDYERTLIFTEFSLAELLLDSGYKLKELFGMQLPKEKTIKGRFYRLAREFWFSLLKLIYILERGNDPALIPHIFSKHIIAVAEK